MIEKRATSKEEKREVLLRLYRLWKQVPELRLTQLIENVFHHDSEHCTYNMEDFDFIEQLEDFYTRKEKLN